MSRSPQLCQSVRRLTFSFESFEVDPTPEQFEVSRGIYIGANQPTAEELNELYATYHRGCERQQQIEESNVDIASLAAAMPHFRTLRSVRVLEHLGSQWQDWFIHDYRGYTGTGPRLFGAITSALYVSGLEIEELHLGSIGSDAPALTGIVHELSSLALLPYPCVFGKLRRLMMILPWMVDAGQVDHRGVLELIQSATLVIEELVLHSDRLGSVLPADFFESLTLPRLRVLSLGSLEFQSPLHLLQFFRKHARTLKEVELRSISVEGSWEPVFIEMRNCSNLESIRLCDLMDNGYEILAGRSYRVVNIRAIEDFIHRRTDDNPFELERLQKSHVL